MQQQQLQRKLSLLSLLFLLFLLLEQKLQRKQQQVPTQQRKRKELESQVSGLKRNDQVVFASGIHGRVVTLGEKVLSVEIAPKVAVQIDRDSVQRVLTAPTAEGREKEREKS